ncbi:hypothetical protein WA538_004783 [Blastocystis sp. DL]
MKGTFRECEGVMRSCKGLCQQDTIILSTLFGITFYCIATMWKTIGLLSQSLFGLDIILAALYYVHLFVPLFLQSFLRSMSEGQICGCIVILKGITMLLEAFLSFHPIVFFIIGIVELLYGLAILLRSGWSPLNRDSDFDESSEIRGELRRLITNTSSSIERYL